MSSLGLRLSTREQNSNSPLVGQAVPVFSLRVCVFVVCGSLFFVPFLSALLTTCPLLKEGTRERVRESVSERAVSVSVWVSRGANAFFRVLFPPLFPSPPCGAAVRRGAGGLDGAVRSPPGEETINNVHRVGW